MSECATGWSAVKDVVQGSTAGMEDIVVLSLLDPQSLASVEQLQCMIARILRHIMDHDWTHPDWAEFFSDDYLSYAPAAFLEDLPNALTTTRGAYIHTYKHFRDENPEYVFTPARIDAYVNEDAGTAEVWAVLDIFGHPPPLRKEGISIIRFVRRENRWVGIGQTGLRGYPT